MEHRDRLMRTADYWKLDVDQAQAFNTDGNTLVVAGPGSGKTRLLVAKAIRLALLTNPGDICIVTFSQSAVKEIKHRLIVALGVERANKINVGTFHGYTYQMLRAFWEAHRRPAPTLLTEFAGKDLMLRCITQLQSPLIVDDALQSLSIAKAQPITAGQPNLTSADPKMAQLLNLYEHKRKAQGAIDFSDMVREAAFALRSGDMAPLRFSKFLADEFQDIDPAQKDWLDFHILKGATLTAVGDDDQAIYGFRASMGFAAMTQFCDQFNAERVNLSTNYRCSLYIIASSRTVIEVSPDRFPKDIRGSSSERGSIAIAKVISDTAAGDEAMASFAHHLIANPQVTFAVISRTNIGLDAMEMAAARAGVPSIRIGSASLLKKETIARRAALLVAVVQPFDKASFVSAVNGLNFTNPGKSSISDFFAQASTKLTITESLFETSLYEVLSRDDATLLRVLRDCMISMGEDYADLTAEPTNDLAVGLFIARCFDRCMRVHKETPILAFLRSVLVTYRRGTVLDRLQSLDKKDANDETKREGVVTLITAHRSKGLEFDHVWIVGCSNGVFPSDDKGEGSSLSRAPKDFVLTGASASQANVFADEERRLFYVSMTRAKLTLTLCYLADQKPNIYLQQLVGSASASNKAAHTTGESVTA